MKIIAPVTPRDGAKLQMSWPRPSRNHFLMKWDLAAGAEDRRRLSMTLSMSSVLPGTTFKRHILPDPKLNLPLCRAVGGPCCR
jgi:hypothetical protein